MATTKSAIAFSFFLDRDEALALICDTVSKKLTNLFLLCVCQIETDINKNW